MKRRSLIGLLAVLLLIPVLAAGCKAQEEIKNVPTPRVDTQTVFLRQDWPDEVRTIEVNGSGEVIAEPDFATVRVGVSVAGESAEAASALCSEREQLIIDAAVAARILRTDITFAGIEIEAKRSEDGEEIVGYQAKDTITVIVRRVADVNSILTTVIDAGASQTFAVSYSITEASSAYREALASAMADAREKADVIAEAAGVQVRSVVGVIEQPYDESGVVGVDFESSAIAVEAKVTVTYRIG